MLIHGTPLQIPFSGGTETEPAFWYWHGASGRRYIHSVYSPDKCPPLPGAVFLAVRRLGALRTVLGAGRFTGLWDINLPAGGIDHWRDLGANEIHVHLLSRSDAEAQATAADLLSALRQDAAAPAIKAPEPARKIERNSVRQPGALAA